MRTQCSFINGIAKSGQMSNKSKDKFRIRSCQTYVGQRLNSGCCRHFLCCKCVRDNYQSCASLNEQINKINKCVKFEVLQRGTIKPNIVKQRFANAMNAFHFNRHASYLEVYQQMQLAAGLSIAALRHYFKGRSH